MQPISAFATPLRSADVADVLPRLVSAIPDGQALLSAILARVRSEAEAGALRAIPSIRAEVRREVKPYVVGAVVIGSLGAALGVAALVRASRRS